MSGICGICQPGAPAARLGLEAMLSGLALPGDSRAPATVGTAFAAGVSQRWPSQQTAEIPGVRVAVDADLIDIAGLNTELGEQLSSPSQLSIAERLAWLYIKLGPGFVKRLRGSFAIALWDERKQLLLLSIDRLGIKSLYWSRDGDRLLFASRVGAIRAAQEQPADVNPAAIMQYLLFSVVPAPLTAYRGVGKMSPGLLLLFQNGEVRQERFWDLDYSEDTSRDERRWASDLREAMRGAIHRNLEGCAAESTGEFLSGGTDSSSVVAFVSERFHPANTFSIAFPEERYNEIGFARTTSEAFRTRHFERCLTPQDIAQAIPQVITYYDEPFGNSSALATYYCAQLARENGMEVLLAGDGGDELFGGNSRYADDKRFALYHSVPSWIRKGILEPGVALFPKSDGKLSLPGRYIRRASIPNPRRIFSYGLFLSTAPEQVFEGDFLRQAPPGHWLDIVEGHFDRAHASSELNRLMYLDLKLILADNDLRKVSGTAELAGVRVRYPLLDYELAEFSGRIPTPLKLKGYEKRYIFKQAMRGILPDKVLFKKKHGFGVPLGHWLRTDPQLKALVQDVLGDPRTRQRGYFREEFIGQLQDLHRRGHAAFYGEVIWYLVALEMWHREHVERRQGVASVY